VNRVADHGLVRPHESEKKATTLLAKMWTDRPEEQVDQSYAQVVPFCFMGFSVCFLP
jgi:hypothetical protein